MNYVSSNLFSHLKEDLEHAKDQLIDVEDTVDLSRLLVITDGLDNFDERFAIAEKLGKRLKLEISRIYLYNLRGSLFKKSQEEDGSVVDSLRAHSSKIRELKLKGVEILFDETVRNFLLESREIRQISTEEKTEFSTDDVGALVEFFLEKTNRDYNFTKEINKYIDTYHPNLVYWKPNLLKDRKWFEEIGISDIEKFILRHVSESSIILLEGKNDLTEVKNVVCYIEGGEAVMEFKKMLNTIHSYFHEKPINVTFSVIIDEHTVNLASIFPDEEDDEKNLREFIKQKLSKQIKQLRIFDKAPEQKIQFGSIDRELEVVLRKCEADILIVSPKYVGGEKFDSNALGVIEIAIKQGIGVLAII
jgi:hypothetical protein